MEQKNGESSMHTLHYDDSHPCQRSIRSNYVVGY